MDMNEMSKTSKLPHCLSNIIQSYIPNLPLTYSMTIDDITFSFTLVDDLIIRVDKDEDDFPGFRIIGDLIIHYNKDNINEYLDYVDDFILKVFRDELDLKDLSISTNDYYGTISFYELYTENNTIEYTLRDGVALQLLNIFNRDNIES